MPEFSNLEHVMYEVSDELDIPFRRIENYMVYGLETVCILSGTPVDSMYLKIERMSVEKLTAFIKDTIKAAKLDNDKKPI